MANEDLSELSGLDDERRSVLARSLDITTAQDLARADPQHIVAAFEGRDDAPTPQEVVAWQAEARPIDRRSTAPPPTQDWEQVAAFVIAFEQRDPSDGAQRRLVVTQVEVETAEPDNRFEQDDWAYEDAGQWMLTQFPGPASEPEPDPASADEGAADAQRDADTGSPAPVGTAEPPPAKLELQRAHLVHDTGEVELVAGSLPVKPTAQYWDRPVHLVVTLDRPATPATVVRLQLRRPGYPSTNVEARSDEERLVFEADLTGVEPDIYVPTIMAAAFDGTAQPRLVKLPAVHIIAAADREAEASDGPAGPGGSLTP